jgi:RecB family endonuclease NucS
MLIRSLGGGSWHTPQTTAYTNEAELRDLLAETPSLLPGIDERPTAAAKEMPISGTGKADVVIVEASGDITVVECKLSTNPEIRR